MKVKEVMLEKQMNSEPEDYITNNSGLPDAIVRAMMNDPYDKGTCDFSATELIKPARICELERRHKHEIKEDAEDGLYRLYGQIAHLILERANQVGIAEKRYYTKVGDYVISAQMDNLSLHNEILSDYKFTSAWGFKSDEPPKPEWVAQLNIQNYILIKNGIKPRALQIVGLIRDFRLNDAKNYDNYPKKPVVVVPIEMWSLEQTEAFIMVRIHEHLRAVVDLDSVKCSKSERWEKAETYAAMKEGRKTAVKVELSREAAQKYVTSPDMYIQVRPGISARCEQYCKVKDFCSQYKEMTNAV